MQVANLALRLKAAGHSIEIICATPGMSDFEGIPVRRLDVGPLLPGVEAAWLPRLLSVTLESVRAGGYDIVHAHSAYSPIALACCRAARMTGTASILTEHSLFRGAERWPLRFFDLLFRWRHFPDEITAVSSVAARDIGELTNRPVSILPNGVDISKWSGRAGVPADKIVTAMRLVPRKRPFAFLEAAAKTKQLLGPGHAAEFTVIGDGPLRAKLERRTEELGLRDSLRFAGWLDHEAMRGEYANAAAFVSLATKEALSIATLEALASGLPVVAMKAGGVRDILDGKGAGVLAGTEEEAAIAMSRFLGDRAFRQRHAANTCATVAPFDWGPVLERHLTLYRKTEARVRETI